MWLPSLLPKEKDEELNDESKCFSERVPRNCVIRGAIGPRLPNALCGAAGFGKKNVPVSYRTREVFTGKL